MPKFDAAVVSDPLDFTFEPFCDCKGRITEPSDHQIELFTKGVSKLMTEMQGKVGDLPDLLSGEVPPDKIAEVMERSSQLAELSTKQQKATARLYSALCSGMPSEADLLSLPLRIRVRFYSWILREVVRPEEEEPATTGRVIQMNSKAGSATGG